MTSTAFSLERTLDAARHRLLARRLGPSALWSVLATAIVAAGAAPILKWFGLPSVWWLVLIPAAAGLAVLIRGFARRPSSLEAAIALDSSHGFDDAMATALESESIRGADSLFVALQRQEAEALIAKVELRRLGHGPDWPLAVGGLAALVLLVVSIVLPWPAPRERPTLAADSGSTGAQSPDAVDTSDGEESKPILSLTEEIEQLAADGDIEGAMRAIDELERRASAMASARESREQTENVELLQDMDRRALLESASRLGEAAESLSAEPTAPPPEKSPDVNEASRKKEPQDPKGDQKPKPNEAREPDGKPANNETGQGAERQPAGGKEESAAKPQPAGNTNQSESADREQKEGERPQSDPNGNATEKRTARPSQGTTKEPETGEKREPTAKKESSGTGETKDPNGTQEQREAKGTNEPNGTQERREAKETNEPNGVPATREDLQRRLQELSRQLGDEALGRPDGSVTDPSRRGDAGAGDQNGASPSNPEDRAFESSTIDIEASPPDPDHPGRILEGERPRDATAPTTNNAGRARATGGAGSAVRGAATDPAVAPRFRPLLERYYDRLRSDPRAGSRTPAPRTSPS